MLRYAQANYPHMMRCYSNIIVNYVKYSKVGVLLCMYCAGWSATSTKRGTCSASPVLLQCNSVENQATWNMDAAIFSWTELEIAGGMAAASLQFSLYLHAVLIDACSISDIKRMPGFPVLVEDCTAINRSWFDPGSIGHRAFWNS